MTDPRIVHQIDQYQAEVMEVAHAFMEEALHNSETCSQELPEWMILLIDSAIMAGANGAMIALANAGRLRTIHEQDDDTVLAEIMRKVLAEDGPGVVALSSGSLSINITHLPITEREHTTIQEVWT